MREFISYISYKFKLLRFILSRPDKKKDNGDVSNLRKKGIIIISEYQNYCNELNKIQNVISKLEVNKIIANKNTHRKETDDNRAKQKREFKIKITNLFEKELLLSYSKNKYINKLVTQYFGFEPIIRNISVWIDIPNNNTKDEVATQIFHRDFDDVKLLKTFLYLNDVNSLNGPFEYIQTSHLEPWKNNKHRENKSIANIFGGENLKSVTGKKNTLIIADTNGFHHGKKLSEGHRLLLTVSYSSKNPSVKIPNEIFD